MYIKMLGEEEIKEAIGLANDVFDAQVAESFEPEGVEEFKKSMNGESLIPLWAKQELFFWGCFADTDSGKVMLGMIALNQNGHLVMFYVRPEHQHHGVGTYLYQTAYDYCTKTLVLTKMTVNAAISAVTVYQHFGFEKVGEKQVVRGIVFWPMELRILPGEMKPEQKSKNKVVGIVALIVAIVTILAVLTFFTFRALEGLTKSIKSSSSITREVPFGDSQEDPDGNNNDNKNGDSNSDSGSDGSTDSQTNSTGIAGINTYTKGSISYSVEEENYNFSDSSKQYYWEFQVKYPQLKNLNNGNADKVNKMLEDCAKDTVNRTHDNPDASVKEKMLEAKVKCGISYVTYKVTYQSEDFISVVFQDQAVIGASTNEYLYLRSMNINLKTGESYDAKDIVNMDDSFMKAWKASMDGEAPNSAFLASLSNETAKEILQGDTKEGEYSSAFFVKEDGIEMGMSYRYNGSGSQDAQTGADSGWITAPFTWDELSNYQSDSPFWSLVK